MKKQYLKKSKYVARASLDNLKINTKTKELVFSGFSIKKSPNCLRNIVTRDENDKSVIVPHFPDEEELLPGFPRCQYYLEIDLGLVEPFAFDLAQEQLIWALDRLRLYKPGLLWGEISGLFDPNNSSVGISELKRNQTEGPYPSVFHESHHGLYIIQKNEEKSIIEFVNSLQNTPKDSFNLALRRFHLYFNRDFVQDRALDLMIALESLFSNDREAIAYKIALRASHLIESDVKKRQELFNFIKEAYEIRSSIVHGRDENNWIEQKMSDNRSNLERLEDIVRKCLLILLKKAQDNTILTPSKMDRFLFFQT